MKNKIEVPGIPDVQLFELMPGNCLLLLPDSPAFTIIAATEGYLQIIGKSSPEVKGTKLSAHFTVDDKVTASSNFNSLQTALEELLSTKHATESRDFPPRSNPDNIEEWKCLNKPVFDADGTITCIIHSIDVTSTPQGSKRYSETITNLEKHYNIFMQAPVTIGIVKGENYIIELANENLLEVWGRTADVIGKPLFEAIPELQSQGFKPLLDEVRLTGTPFQAFELPITLNRNGNEEVLYFNFVYNPFYEQGSNEPAGVFAVGHDITLQVLSRRKAEESEQRFRDLIEQATVATGVYLGKEMRIEYANDAMLKIFGRGKDITGKTIVEVVPESGYEQLWQQLYRVYETGETYIGKEGIVEIVADGKVQTCYFNHSYKALRTREGEIYGILNMAVDVTEQVIARKEQEQANTELQFVTDTMPQLVWATEPDGSSVFFNKGWFDYTGLEFNEIKGDGWVRAVHPEDREKSLQAWKLAVQKTGSYDVEYRIKRSDGAYRWFVARGVPMRDSSGKIVKWYGTSTDINDQKLVVEALKQSHERFNLVSKATQDAIWDWDLNTNTLWWNEAYKTLFGYKEEQISPGLDSWTNCLHPEEKDDVLTSIHQAIDSGGKQWTQEYRFRRADGTYATVYDRGYILRNEYGQPYRMLGSMQDISERKQYEASVTASEERFRTLANSISQLAWMADGSGSIYWYNQRFLDYTGIAPEDMKDETWSKIHHPAYIDMAEDFVSKSWERGQPWEITLPLRSKSGDYRWFLSRVYPVKDANGNIVQWIGTNTDITEQREASAVLEQRVKERTQELEIRNAELEQFTYVSHHDLQEPLRKIIMFADLIRAEAKEKLSDIATSRLEKIARAAYRMSAALKDVLNFASLDKEEQFVQVDLNEVLTSIQSDLELVISEKNANIQSDQLPVIRAVPQQMHQLFYNLLGNALKFSKTDRSPQVTITAGKLQHETITSVHSELDPAREYYQLTVMDNGIGFGQDAAAMIFGMFQRLHSKDAYAGTGIGLALCRKVVQNHGGKIWAESVPGSGSTFVVILPLE